MQFSTEMSNNITRISCLKGHKCLKYCSYKCCCIFVQPLWVGRSGVIYFSLFMIPSLKIIKQSLIVDSPALAISAWSWSISHLLSCQAGSKHYIAINKFVISSWAQYSGIGGIWGRWLVSSSRHRRLHWGHFSPSLSLLMRLRIVTDKQTNRQTDKQTNRQTDKQTCDRQTDTCTEGTSIQACTSWWGCAL